MCVCLYVWLIHSVSTLCSLCSLIHGMLWSSVWQMSLPKHQNSVTFLMELIYPAVSQNQHKKGEKYFYKGFLSMKTCWKYDLERKFWWMLLYMGTWLYPMSTMQRLKFKYLRYLLFQRNFGPSGIFGVRLKVSTYLFLMNLTRSFHEDFNSFAKNPFKIMEKLCVCSKI